MTDDVRAPRKRTLLSGFYIRPVLAFALGVGLAFALDAMIVLLAVQREKVANEQLHKSVLALELTAGRLGVSNQNRCLRVSLP